VIAVIVDFISELERCFDEYLYQRSIEEKYVSLIIVAVYVIQYG